VVRLLKHDRNGRNGRADDEWGSRAPATTRETTGDIPGAVLRPGVRLGATQLSLGLLQNLSWSGVFQTLVLLLALWAVWANTAGLTDRLDPQQPLIQLLVIATMFATLIGRHGA
jgi:hypothetical protein